MLLMQYSMYSLLIANLVVFGLLGGEKSIGVFRHLFLAILILNQYRTRSFLTALKALKMDDIHHTLPW
jgi:hypothetical protein